MTNEHESSASISSVLNSVLAGYAAGISGTLVGHPFDSAKVWLQTQQQRQAWVATNSVTKSSLSTQPATSTVQNTLYNNATPARTMHTAALRNSATSLAQILSQIKALYAGVAGPLMTVGLVQSINFAVYDSMRRFLYRGHSEEGNYLHHDSLANVAIASTTAGAVLALFTSPMLIAKVQQQTIPDLSFQQALKRTWRAGMFVGFGPHLFSETAGRAAYFVSYEFIKRNLVQWRTGRTDAVDLVPTLPERMTSAAASGIVCWSLIFPLDALRCRLYAQTAKLGDPQLSTIEMAKHMYRSGWKTFYRGFGVTVLRAGPVAAAVLPCYDCAHDFLSQR